MTEEIYTKSEVDIMLSQINIDISNIKAQILVIETKLNITIPTNVKESVDTISKYILTI